eukprot:306427-Amphidinium_carterae.1
MKPLRAANIPADRVVACHGTMHESTQAHDSWAILCTSVCSPASAGQHRESCVPQTGCIPPMEGQMH